MKTYTYGSTPNIAKKTAVQTIKNEEEEGQEQDEPEEVCLIWPTPNKCNCPWAWSGGGKGLGSWNPDLCDYCSGCVDSTCIGENPPDPPIDPPVDPPGTGGGNGEPGTGGNSGGGGGGTGSGDYNPSCNPDPNYVVPNYPAPEGMEWIVPCGDVPVPETPGEEPVISYEGLDISAGVLAIAVRLGLSHQEALFLENNPSTVTEIIGYLAQHLSSIDADEFAKWAVEYLMENTDIPFSEILEMNNIPNSTITLPNIIDVTDLTAYPAFKSMIENLPAFLNQNPEVLKSLSRYTGFSKTKILQLMQPGKGPKIELVSNLVNEHGQPCIGQYTPGTYFLKMKKELVVGLDKVQSPKRYGALGMLLCIVTLHEFVHYGRDVNKMSRKVTLNGWEYDVGVLFEFNISPPYLYDKITRNNAI